MATLAERIAILEQQVARLQKTQPTPSDRAWLDDVYGSFRGDAIFQEAMELGRKYRQSLRPRHGKRKSRR
jgi:hypothetical protein